MKTWIVRCLAAGTLLALQSQASANPPIMQQPVMQPVPAVPFGYYPTQWRSYPVAILDPDIRIILPPDRRDLPDPIPVVPHPKKESPSVDPKKDSTPKLEPKKEMLPALNPKNDVLPPIEPKKAPVPEKTSERTPSKIYPPDYIPEAKVIQRDPNQLLLDLPEMHVPLVQPEIKVLEPKLEPAAVKPQILHLLPKDDGFRKTEPLKNTAEEESEPRLKPKAWIEVPPATPAPIVRGSSHSLGEKFQPNPVWRTLPVGNP